MEHWGYRLQQALQARKIRKLHALAVEIGIDQSAISRWRNGMPISLRNAVALSRALDVSLDWLVMGRGAIDMHRVVPSAPVDLAAHVLFGNLTKGEAIAVRHVLALLSEAAGRRANLSDA
jgi:transcriptional regulator with XRE-family HTH domain